MSSVFGRTGTIYDSAPVRPFIFRTGSPDLNEALGGGFQAAHIWVNNQSNQNLYLPDAPDVVPPGVSRVVAIGHTDVARASWTIPSQFAIQQPATPIGAAILIFMNEGVDIAPHPGIAQNPIQAIQPGSVSIMPSTVLTAAAASGQAKITPQHQSIFFPGAIINLNPIVSGVTGFIGFVKSVNADGTVTLTSNLLANYQIGDALNVLGAVGIFGQPIGTSTRHRTWDVQGFAQPGAGIQAILTFAAVAGKQYEIEVATGHYVSVVAAADGAGFEVLQPGGVTIYWREVTGTQAVIGSTDHAGSERMAIPFPTGVAAQIAFALAPQNASNQQSVHGGGYLVSGEPV